MEIEERIVAIVDRVGGGVREREIAYQLARGGERVPAPDLMDALAALLDAGRLECETVFRIAREARDAA